MAYPDFEPNYDRFPETRIEGFDEEAFEGWAGVGAAIVRAMAVRGGRVLVVDCYPGIRDVEVLAEIERVWKPNLTIDTTCIFYPGDELTRLMARNLTTDRVRGNMYYGTVSDFIDPALLAEAQAKVAAEAGRVLVYGVAASLVCSGDLLVYADMARWEIRRRYRAGMPNYKQDNGCEDILRKYKRGYFVEWRVADRHKSTLYGSIDFYLDTNTAGTPHMVTGEAFRAGLRHLAHAPFRLVPYFDPGIWGGQWMRRVCRLPDGPDNYAWCFDGVPEENSVYLRFGNVRIESPAMNLTKYLPVEFLGEKTFARFGAECPIRFDLLDTMGGQNLSLQVHPMTEYIHERFGMAYTQDESYYILDAKPGACVYLGLREGIDRQAMIDGLEVAQEGGAPFDADRFVGRWPAKAHDHFLIPAGTVHCSGAGCMVLEVSATPYIFTFKLWDWNRLGTDGLPRPIHIQDGSKVIRWDRTTGWVRENLVDRFECLSETPAATVVHTGLHELEFIETHAIEIRTGYTARADGEFAMLNLVGGREAIIESPTGTWEPYRVHYAETFIVPAAAGDYLIRPSEGLASVKVLQAKVRAN